MISRRDILASIGSLFALSLSSFDLGRLYGRRSVAGKIPAPAKVPDLSGWWVEWNGFVIQIKEYYYNTSRSSYSNFMGGSLAIAGKLTTASGPVATMGDRMMDPGDGKLAFCLDGATVIRGKDASPTSVHIDMFEDEIHVSFTFTLMS